MVYPTIVGGGSGFGDDDNDGGSVFDASSNSSTSSSTFSVLTNNDTLANGTIIADLLLHNDTIAQLLANKTSALTSLLIDGVTAATTKVLLNHSTDAAVASDQSVAANYTDFSDTSMTEETRSDYVFDRTYVRVIFITFYATVFCGCVFGE